MKKEKAKNRTKEQTNIKFRRIKSISLVIFLVLLFVCTNIASIFFKQEVTETTSVAAIDINYLAENELKTLNDYNLNRMVGIEGSEAGGYYFTFPEEKFKEILNRTLFEKDVSYGNLGTNNIDALVDFIKAELFTTLPNISKDPENIRTDGNKIQGAVKFKRRSFNKEIGDYEQEVLEDDTIEADTSTHTIVIDAGHGSDEDGQVTNNYSDIATSEEELNNGKAKYLEGNSGTDSEGNEYKEWELNQKVVDLVIQKLSNYPSINIIQTGKDLPDYQRLQLAKDAGAEAYISVHFNESDDNRGTEVLISPSVDKESESIEGEVTTEEEILGDNSTSEEFGSVLLEAVSSQMHMGKATNVVVQNNKETKSVLKPAGECGFPNIYIYGNCMETDVLDELMKDNEQGLDDYAQGIVNGILEYFEAQDNVSETSGINASETEKYLVYTSPENFDNMINNSDANVLNYFTLDDDKNMIIANWAHSSTEGTTFSKSSANEYITKIQQYAMPYQYPLAFLLDTGAEAFSRQLANLSLNSDIIMTVFDNVTVTVDKVITTNITESRYRYWYEYHINSVDSNNNPGGETFGEVTSVSDEPIPVSTAREESRASLQLTSADAWCVQYEKFFTSERTDSGFVRVGDIERTEGEWASAGSAIITREEVVGENTRRVHYQQLQQRPVVEVENQTRTVTYVFKENPNRESILNGNVNKFVNLIRKYRGTALTNIESDNGQGLIELLASKESTSNMVELTQWLLQEASKKIYFGLVKYDFSEFDPANFTSVSTTTGISSSNLLLDYLKAWENGTLWDYEKGNISYSSYVARYITEDKTQYVCFTDGDGRLNFGYGMCHYYSGHFNHVELYASLGVDITQYNEVGMTLDAEIVDKAKLKFIEGVRQSVNSKLTAAGIQLEDYQVNSLIALAYQWGDHIIDDFIPAYQQYGNTEELRQNFVNSNDPSDVPFLNGNGSSGSQYEVQRGNANWTLFHEGRYILPGGSELNPSDYTTSGDVGQLVEQNQNGIYGTYTASSGKTFIEYRQCSGPWGTPPWAGVPYWDGTISSSGCGPTSAAIALTGYGVSVTPEDTANAISNRYGSSTQTDPNSLTWVVNNFGVSAHTDGWGNVTSDKIANNLRQGRPVLISVGTSPDTRFTSGGHLMALIDIDSNNNVYVSNPSTTDHGWIPLSTVIQYCSYKWAVYFDE